jgi:predicted nucleic acid-binding protein
MPSHLLDTSVYCQPLKPRPLPTVERRWAAIGDTAVAVSVVCEAELLFGLALNPSARLTSLYESSLKGRYKILPVDSLVAGIYGQMKATCRKQGLPLPDFDLLIAATARAHGLILATLNARHFRRIEGLAVEDWAR